MQHNSRQRQIKRIRKTFKHLAAALAGAAIMSSAMIPGLPAAAVQAAPNPDTGITQTAHDKAAPQDTGKQHSEKSGTEKQNIPDNYQDVVEVTATAYAPGPHDNDQWGNKTHLGTNIRPGVIAVDPDVIPLGSEVYIAFKDGTGMHATAEDTGGAIKGNRIDVAKWSVGEAQDFGLQKAKVYIINKGEK
jgi:3D (Asp-Asp-Asp) domain-containing protein